MIAHYSSPVVHSFPACAIVLINPFRNNGDSFQVTFANRAGPGTTDWITDLETLETLENETHGCLKAFPARRLIRLTTLACSKQYYLRISMRVMKNYL